MNGPNICLSLTCQYTYYIVPFSMSRFCMSRWRARVLSYGTSIKLYGVFLRNPTIANKRERTGTHGNARERTGTHGNARERTGGAGNERERTGTHGNAQERTGGHSKDKYCPTKAIANARYTHKRVRTYPLLSLLLLFSLLRCCCYCTQIV